MIPKNPCICWTSTTAPFFSTDFVLLNGNGCGNKTNQLNDPTDVITDGKNNSLIISDLGNTSNIMISSK
jgi:hypothetical protein